MPSASVWLERALRVACVVYPREFRRLLCADMATLYAREVRSVAQQRGRTAALGYALDAWLRTVAGAVPAHLQGVHPPRIQMDALWQDVRFAFRSLAKSPAFVAVAVGSLALGIGANTAIFSVVNSLLLQGLPYRDADRLVVLWETNPELGVFRAGPSGATFMDWRERTQSFEALMLFEPGSATVTDLAEPEQVPAMRVTTNFFDVLGYTPAQGRDFLSAEGRGGRQNVAVITDGFWRRAYGADLGILGREFMADHIPYTVVGVLPADFFYPVRADLFVPWDDEELRDRSRNNREYAALGLLAPGVTVQQAQDELDALHVQLEREYDAMAGWSADLTYARDEITGPIRPALLILLGAVGLVLLIACANVANMLLARAAARHHEIAVRAATGASRLRLVRQLLTESAVLALAGGVGGLLVGVVGVRGLRALLPGEIPLEGVTSILLPTITIEPVVVGFTAVIALITGMVFGVVPAWQTSLIDLTGSLKESERGSGTGGGRARNVFVAAEVALSVVLLVGVFLMIQTLWNLSAVDVGFDPESVVTIDIELPTDSRYTTDAEEAAFYRELMARLSALPGVEAAGISEIVPLDNTRRQISVGLLDRQPSASREGVGVDYNAASAGYFEAMRVPLLSGRMVDDTDDDDHASVVLVDATFAERHFAGRDPLGEQLRISGSDYEIVGVVGAVRSVVLDDEPVPMIYLSYLQWPDNYMKLTLRTRGTPEGIVTAVKEAVWAIDPEQPVFNVRSMESVVAATMVSRRVTLSLLALFGVVAMLMAALGVYGVMSYAVGQRTRELGLRQALGADRRRVLSMVVREGLRLSAWGVAGGALAALVLTRALSSLLFGVSATQPLAFVAVAVLLVGVSVLATFVPARRAAAVDPMVALRAS